MDSNQSDRRRFLKQAAAGVAAGAAGFAAGAQWSGSARAQSAERPDNGGVREVAESDDVGHVHRAPPRRGARYSLDHMTHYTPLQDYAGIITPAPVHFVQQHSSEFPEIDPREHRLTIHGLVDRPLSFSMDDLKRLPSVSRIHFVECHGNSSPAIHGSKDPKMGLPVQFIHGMASTSEWTGVPLSVLLNESGLKKNASWLVSEGADVGKFSHTLPLGKALDDCFVAYGQNGDPLRVEQGFPIRLLVPGWEGPFNVKYLRHIKVVDEPYNTWNESMNHSVSRPDLGGKARWYHFQWAAKSVITRPSGGMEMRKGFVQVTGLAWSGAGKVAKVEVSTDGGRNWREARLDGVIVPKAHTRFNYDWEWNGQETTIMSRCIDETGDVQPSLAELSAHWQIPMEDWHKPERPRAIHMNAIQPWKINRDGSIIDAMFA
jgi:sulfane dehydrogenase subunit SoxC